MVKRFFYIVFGIVCFSGVRLQATDLPVFYRAPFFQAFHDQQPDWTTQLSVRFGAGHSRSGWNHGEHKTSFLNMYGPTDLTRLGLGLEFSDKAPKTKEYWGTTGNVFLKDENLKGMSGDDGKLAIEGKLKVYDLGFTVKQSIFSGFYVQAYIPVRRAKLEELKVKNLGSEVLKDKDGSDFLNVNDFVEGKNTYDNAGLPVVLKENKFAFENFEKSHFKETTVPDVMLSVGWQGKGSENFGYIDLIRGFMQAGIIAPMSGRKNEDLLFSIPLGYNDFWGFNAQASAEVALWKIVVGAHAGVNVFLPSSRVVRMKTDPDQSGWTVLGKARAKVDKGTMWNVSGYVKAHQIYEGLSVLVGYTYVHQEDADLLVKDGSFLNSVVEAGKTKDPTKPVYISKEGIVNSDQRFRNWNQQTIHVLAEYNARVHTDSWFAPMVRVEYACPVVGKRSGSVDMLAGTLGVQITWDI